MPHILLIEDYLPHACMMNLDLTDAGFKVTALNTGEAALAAIAKLAPNLVVLDWHLPGLNGLETCRQLRSHGYTRPIVFVTAMAMEEHRRAGLAAGANAYLIKPFAPRALLRAIADCLNVSVLPEPEVPCCL
jgi:two-component system phosphate regulon response regulator PhoB